MQRAKGKQVSTLIIPAIQTRERLGFFPQIGLILSIDALYQARRLNTRKARWIAS